jgi:hypothetical protein
MGRLRDERFVVDVRTVFPQQEDGLIRAIHQALLEGNKPQSSA